jgi:hypothetical protein
MHKPLASCHKNTKAFYKKYYINRLSLLIMTKNELLQFLDSWDTLTLLKNLAEGKIDFLPELMDIALHGNNRQSWRATWIADKVNEQQPGVIEPWIAPMTEALKGLNHSGKKRQFLKLISLYPLSVENQSFLIDYCLHILDGTGEPPAVKAHAMQILYNISEIQPDLKEELLEIMEFLIEIQESPGIQARARKLAEKLSKEVRARG